MLGRGCRLCDCLVLPDEAPDRCGNFVNGRVFRFGDPFDFFLGFAHSSLPCRPRLLTQPEPGPWDVSTRFRLIPELPLSRITLRDFAGISPARQAARVRGFPSISATIAFN